ncbi:MAG: Nif3-like dinuclear metal center hexameric protein [Thermoleophilia bacterium]|nr:Nif3-like dinuclear metal center hexameric protein [Thermoleophilia bacterium]
MTLDELSRELDSYFRLAGVDDDDWSRLFDAVYPDPYWLEFAEPGYDGRWNGLMVRGADEVTRAATCVFPGDAVVAQLEPGTLLFSEHPLDFGDEPGFLPLARETFVAMRERGISFYNVHAPLDQHPEIAPSLMCARAAGLQNLEDYFRITEALPEGAAVVGDSTSSLEELAEAFRSYLGPEIGVHVITRPRPRAGRVAVAAGGGATPEILEASLERGCQTYVTGNAATNCRVPEVQAELRRFRQLAEEHGVALIDATHYGMEKPPQLAMADWFRGRGLVAEFIPNGPK